MKDPQLIDVTPRTANFPGKAYTLDVPKDTETLVVDLKTNARSQSDYVPTFTSPSGQVVSRAQLNSEDFYGGGSEDLMRIASPAAGSWELDVLLVARIDFATQVKAAALFHMRAFVITDAVAHPASGRAPLTVAFDASGTTMEPGANATYCWQFTDDSSTAWGVKVTHVFRQSGEFEALLTVTDNAGFQGFGHAHVSVAS